MYNRPIYQHERCTSPCAQVKHFQCWYTKFLNFWRDLNYILATMCFFIWFPKIKIRRVFLNWMNLWLLISSEMKPGQIGIAGTLYPAVMCYIIFADYSQFSIYLPENRPKPATPQLDILLSCAMASHDRGTFQPRTCLGSAALSAGAEHNKTSRPSPRAQSSNRREPAPGTYISWNFTQYNTVIFTYSSAVCQNSLVQ